VVSVRKLPDCCATPHRYPKHTCPFTTITVRLGRVIVSLAASIARLSVFEQRTRAVSQRLFDIRSTSIMNALMRTLFGWKPLLAFLERNAGGVRIGASVGFTPFALA
jgi:hypothetical protein